MESFAKEINMNAPESFKYAPLSYKKFKKIISEEWYLPLGVRENLQSSFIRLWEADWLWSQEIQNGTLLYEGNYYKIVWLSLPSETYKGKIGLSFRLRNRGWPNYVLIKKWKGD
jgi:hypothetical protein